MMGVDGTYSVGAPPRGALAAMVCAAAAILAAAPARADSLPPITAEERALTAVPGAPNAPAVVLFKRGEFWMMDPARHDISSRLQVQVRLKILTEAGIRRGDVEILHSRDVRLQGFQGRTVLSDGRVIPVPREATFKLTASRSSRIFVTSVAFSEVKVGAILEYQYDERWDHPFFLEPWYFQERIPVRHSEIVYQVPFSLQAKVWQSDLMRVGIKSEQTRLSQATRFRAWADNLPPVPEEPFGVPYADMAAQEMMVPVSYTDSGVYEPLLDTWATTCRLFEENVYGKAHRKDGSVARRAREIVAAAVPPGSGGEAGTERRAAVALYEFVRDTITTEPRPGVGLPENDTLGQVLERRRGDYAEKALLLQAMLAAVKIDARLVWAGDRQEGGIDMSIPNPAWFDRVLVAAQIDGKRVFLDPGDRALTFGHLRPGQEDTPALLFDAKKPEPITLPEAPFTDNRRQAKVEVTLDDSGRASGHGKLALTGHHAWRRTRWKDDAQATSEAWGKWLEDAFPGFQIGGVTVAESLAEPRVEVAWTMAQRGEEALGDEVTLVPSRPFPVATQPFPPGQRRRSAVLFDFADRDEIELAVHWPRGWKVDARPRPWRHESAAGAIVTDLEVDPAARTFVYRRRLDVVHRKAATTEQFNLVQTLFAEAKQNDAQPLVFAHR
jgi:Domain of Unknown Function with PDB structure (DUF3857)/Transglutaminase-like superfamily